MSEHVPLVVHITPNTLAYLQMVAQRTTDQMKRDGQYQPGDDVTAETVATVLIEQVVLAQLGIKHNGSNS